MDVPYMLPLLPSIISSPFSSCHHFQQPCSLHSTPQGLHPTSSSATHVLHFCFCAVVLGKSCFFCPALCGHSCMNSDGVEQTFLRKVLFCSTSCSGGDKGVYPKCKLRLEVPQEGTRLMQDTTLNTSLLL